MKALSILIVVLFSLVVNNANAQNTSKQDRVRTDRFNSIDADGNEVITIREMKSYYENRKTKKGEAIDAKKLFYALDANENSIITINEYLKGEDFKLAYKYVNKWEFKEVVKENNDVIVIDDEEITKDEIVLDKEEVKKSNDAAANEEIAKDETVGDKDIINADEMITDASTNKAKTKFEKIDADKNEILSLTEVSEFYKGKVNKNTGELIDGKLNFYTYDINDDGKVTFDEFNEKPNWQRGHERFNSKENKGNSNYSDQPSQGYVKKRIALFQEVDTDDDFKVSLKELKAYYKDKLNNKGKPVNAQFKFFGLDTNEDNSIELAEFAAKIDMDLARKKYSAWYKENN